MDLLVFPEMVPKCTCMYSTGMNLLQLVLSLHSLCVRVSNVNAFSCSSFSLLKELLEHNSA